MPGIGLKRLAMSCKRCSIETARLSGTRDYFLGKKIIIKICGILFFLNIKINSLINKLSTIKKNQQKVFCQKYVHI